MINNESKSKFINSLDISEDGSFIIFGYEYGIKGWKIIWDNFFFLIFKIIVQIYPNPNPLRSNI